MVSYEELIYHFTDIYLKSAIDCSICKENYTMKDDRDCLDDSIRFFASLLNVLEENDDLELESVKCTLKQKREEQLQEFQVFMKSKILEMLIEKMKEKDEFLSSENGLYMEKFKDVYAFFIGEEYNKVKDDPVELLRYIRSREEIFRKQEM